MIVGIGIDLVDIDRIRSMLGRQGERLTTRLFTARESAYAMKRANPAMHLAARLAAKEAAFKALSGNDLARGVGWKEIEVLSTEHGPDLLFHGLAKERAGEIGVTKVHVTLTHTHSMAAAVVVLES